MTTPRPAAGIGDVSMIYGLKDLPLLSRDSVRMTFVIALAETEQLLKQTIDQTTNEWFARSAVADSRTEENSLRILPNPFSHHLHLTWKNEDAGVPGSR